MRLNEVLRNALAFVVYNAEVELGVDIALLGAVRRYHFTASV